MRLADALVADGHAVKKLIFNVGDAVYWGTRPAVHYRGRQADYPDFLRTLVADGGFSDIVMHGDSRFIHSAAVKVGVENNLRLHVFEEGYFRPNWLTLERGGINGYSRLPKDPVWYKSLAPHVPIYDNGLQVRNPTWLLALHELAYHLPNIGNYLLYPGYRTHRPHVSAVELAGWAMRFARLPLLEKRDNQTINTLIESGQPFYFLPLQLDSDSQIRDHSDYDNISQVIDEVVHSFAGHAPKDSLLVIKNHPHDIGMVAFFSLIADLSRALDIEGRVIFLESGNLPLLLSHARGVITVNSTVGTSALFHRRPLMVLGRAIYDLPGLTFQGRLWDFWTHAEPPDAALFSCFRNVAIHATQINGGLYSSHGIRLGVNNCLNSLYADKSPLDVLLEQ